MSDYLPFLIALLIFPVSFFAHRIPDRLQTVLLLLLAALFTVFAFTGVGPRYPNLFFAVMAVGLVCRRYGWLGSRNQAR